MDAVDLSASPPIFSYIKDSSSSSTSRDLTYLSDFDPKIELALISSIRERRVNGKGYQIWGISRLDCILVKSKYHTNFEQVEKKDVCHSLFC